MSRGETGELVFVRPVGDLGPLDLQLPDRWSLGAIVGGDGDCCEQAGGDTGDDNCRRAADPGGSGMCPHGMVLLIGPDGCGHEDHLVNQPSEIRSEGVGPQNRLWPGMTRGFRSFSDRGPIRSDACQSSGETLGMGDDPHRWAGIPWRRALRGARSDPGRGCRPCRHTDRAPGATVARRAQAASRARDAPRRTEPSGVARPAWSTGCGATTRRKQPGTRCSRTCRSFASRSDR